MIRDDGGTRLAPQAWQSGDEFMDACRGWAAELRLDRSSGQKIWLAVICEAAGMAQSSRALPNRSASPDSASAVVMHHRMLRACLHIAEDLVQDRDHLLDLALRNR